VASAQAEETSEETKVDRMSIWRRPIRLDWDGAVLGGESLL
jgi:hypothetical protein